jgi:hypothetical protein
MMFRDLEHPDVSCAIRTGYPSWMQEDEVLNDEDGENYESEFWGDDESDDYCDYLYEERRDRERFGD